MSCRTCAISCAGVLFKTSGIPLLAILPPTVGVILPPPSPRGPTVPMIPPLPVSHHEDNKAWYEKNHDNWDFYVDLGDGAMKSVKGKGSSWAQQHGMEVPSPDFIFQTRHHTVHVLPPGLERVCLLLQALTKSRGAIYFNKARSPSADLHQWRQQPVSNDASVRQQCLESCALCKAFAQPPTAVAREQLEQPQQPLPESLEQAPPGQQQRQAPEQLQQQQRRQQQPEEREQASSSQAPSTKRRMCYDPARVTSYYEQAHCVSGPSLLVRDGEPCDKKVICEIFSANAYKPPASTGTLFQRRPDDHLGRVSILVPMVGNVL